MTHLSPIDAYSIIIRLSIFSAKIDTVSGRNPAKAGIFARAGFGAPASYNSLHLNDLRQPA
jgi:hypothetical protein